jgi:hypothetical protein
MKKIVFAFAMFSAGTSFAECIPGEALVRNEQDRTRVAIGQQLVLHTEGLKQIHLEKKPDYQDTQMYLFVSAPISGSVVAEDWCYETDNNEVRLLREPRMIPIFGSESIPLPADSEIWVGYHSSEDFEEECVPGLFLNYLPGDSTGNTFGQESFQFSPEQRELRLSKQPIPGHQMYIYSGMWIYGLDWCYSARDNAIRFESGSPRFYALGGIPGRFVAPDTYLWVGYVPVENP